MFAPVSPGLKPQGSTDEARFQRLGRGLRLSPNGASLSQRAVSTARASWRNSVQGLGCTPGTEFGRPLPVEDGTDVARSTTPETRRLTHCQMVGDRMDSLFSRGQAPPVKQKLVLVSHTHWDREWYLPFQEFRVRLVRLIDLLLDIMELDPNYRHFTLDGQTIVLEDYLEVRPEREGELRRLVREGRILIGPWYVIPDEFLVGGESIIRNLIAGHRQAKRFGSPMRVGYLPDPFGHITQLPQILRGFDIDSALLWRGVGGKARKSEFIWRAPNGSEVLAIYTPRGYDNAAILPSSIPQLMESVKDIRAALTPYATTEYLLLLNGDDHLEPQPNLPRLIAAANGRLKDAELIHGTLPLLIQGIRESATQRNITWQVVDGEMRSAELAHILAGVLSTRMDIKQQNHQVETLLTKWAEPFSLFAALETRRFSRQPRPNAWMPLLRLAWRYTLQNHPHDSICGCSIDQVGEDVRSRFTWGRQIGQMVTQQSLETLATSINTAAMPVPPGYGALAGGTQSARGGEGHGYVVVFNPDSGPRTDFVEVSVQLPPANADLALADEQGTLLPYQVLRLRQSELYSQTISRDRVAGYLRMAGLGGGWPVWKIKILEGIVTRLLKGKIPVLAVTAVSIRPSPGHRTVDVEVEMGPGGQNYEAIASALRQASALVDLGEVQFFRVRVIRRDEADIGFIAPAVPAHGYRVFQLLTGHRQRVAMSGEIASNVIQNEYLSVQVNTDDGALTVSDRETGITLSGVNAVIDGGDAGDEYTYSPPTEDLIISQPSQPPTIALVENGPARLTLRVQRLYSLPASLTPDRRARSADVVACPITSYVTLYQGVKRVDIRTEVHNQARDHRLRVLMPIGIQTQQSHAEGHFAVVSRPVGLPSPREDWLEHPVSSHPQKAFVDVNDGQIGLMVANKGLPEYDVSPDGGGTVVALTLLRCVGWLSRDDLTTREGAAGPILPTPNAQMIGHHTFEYCLIPHAGSWETHFRQAHWFAHPLRAIRTNAHGGSLPTSTSFLDVKPGSVVVSAIKAPEEGEGIVLRCFNITGVPVTAQITVFASLVRAERLNLNEESRGEFPLNDEHTVYLPLSPHEIATLRLHPAPYST